MDQGSLDRGESSRCFGPKRAMLAFALPVVVMPRPGVHSNDLDFRDLHDIELTPRSRRGTEAGEWAVPGRQGSAREWRPVVRSAELSENWLRNRLRMWRWTRSLPVAAGGRP